MDDRSLYKKIKRIQIKTSKLADDILAGEYRSAFKGRGMEFEEVREYLPGDDVRTIDWNVTARSDRAFVKNFREERDLTVMLLIDVSNSTHFGSNDRFKSDIMSEISATISFSAIKNNDKIGLILFSDVIEKYIPPKKGSSHVLRIIKETLSFKAKNLSSDLKVALDFLGKVQKKSSVTFLMTDFIFQDNYSNELSLIAKKHDLITLLIKDRFEMEFPSLGLIELKNLESQISQLIDSSDKNFQRRYKENANEKNTNIHDLLKKNGIEFLEILTDEDYVKALLKFFKRRARGYQLS